MAKTFWLELAQRNDRIFKAAAAGAIIYGCAVLAVAPSTPAQADVLVLNLRGAAGIGDQVLTGSGERRLTGAVNRVRNLVNKPSYDTYLREKNCLAQAIYFEARSESQLGQKAVAEVVLARTRAPDRPKTICGVVYEGAEGQDDGYCQFSFACDGIPEKVRDRGAWNRALRIASNTMRTGGRVNSVVGNATYYHATYVKPSWASSMVKVARIGTHIFYRERRRG
jgi:spore germination cell wall hydrolase CwlJ-like protein